MCTPEEDIEADLRCCEVGSPPIYHDAGYGRAYGDVGSTGRLISKTQPSEKSCVIVYLQCIVDYVTTCIKVRSQYASSLMDPRPEASKCRIRRCVIRDPNRDLMRDFMRQQRVGTRARQAEVKSESQPGKYHSARDKQCRVNVVQKDRAAVLYGPQNCGLGCRGATIRLGRGLCSNSQICCLAIKLFLFGLLGIRQMQRHFLHCGLSEFNDIPWARCEHGRAH